MKEQRKKELEALLDDSLNSAEISYNQQLVTHEQYRQMVLSNEHNFNVSLRRLACYLTIQDGAVKQKLVDFCKYELKDCTYRDELAPCLVCIGGSMIPMPFEYLVNALCGTSIVYSASEAVSIFDSAVKRNGLKFQEMILLNGLTIDQEVKLSNGVKLVPIPNSLNDFPHYLPITFPPLNNVSNSFSSRTILIMDYLAFPLFSSSYTSMQSSFQTKCISKEYEEIALCTILSLYFCHPVQNYTSWKYLDRRELFGINFNHSAGGAGERVSAYYDPKKDPMKISILEEDIAKIKKLYRDFINLDSVIKERMKVPIQRLLKSERTNYIDYVSDIDKADYVQYTDQMIDLGIALESLLLGKDNRSNMSSNLSLRAAWYLGTSPKDRKRIFDIVRNIYRLRSKAVHNGRFPKGSDMIKIENKNIPLGEFIDMARMLCRQSILKIIEDGNFPDWDNIVLNIDTNE